jgi:hypothetical protein
MLDRKQFMVHVFNSTQESRNNFSSYVILPAALGSGVYSTSNRNEYQKQKYNSGWWLALTSLAPSVRPYRPPRPVMGIAFIETILLIVYLLH